jgi:uncharacterized protein YqfB (UPF0267 family)
VRDYKNTVIELVKESYNYYEQSSVDFEKAVFKEVYRMICDIIKHNGDDFECSINNITIALISMATYLELDKEEHLANKLDDLMEIITKIYPAPPKL